MPPEDANSLGDAVYSQILAYLLQQNGIAAGSDALPVDQASQSALLIPAPQLQTQAVVVSTSNLEHYSNGPLVDSRLLDEMRPVTEAMLQNPLADDWINWRRTRNPLGHSPLAEINRSNVERLQLAWSWSLPSGANMMTPIVHDGVIFALSHGDILQALDATTGELLWSYQQELEAGYRYDAKKGVAIYDDKVVFATSDIHLVAVNAKTGQLEWDHKVDVDNEDSFLFKAAPVIANGKAIIGLTGRRAVEGGNFVLAVDMETGQEAWRFYVIPRPGEPGDNTWNGLPLEERNGGSMWIPGTYDQELNLIYFGPAPTYDTHPLRASANDPGITSDALYTNSTIALNADTGELVWHYQHAANDQLDHDWVFERQIIDLPINNEIRKTVVTGGKLAIFEALDAATGEYLLSIDLDMQNVVTEIDPLTGRKSTNPLAIPSLNQVLTQYSMPGICPDWLGARNMQSTAYNVATGLLFIPLSDTCMDDNTGERWQKYPDPATAGSYGIIQALDLRTRKVAWTTRLPGPQASANLITDGGLLFTGSIDRWFRALDQDNGEVLWERRLDNALNSYPVTYRVDGRQYVAVATNSGGIHTWTMQAAADINLPPEGATLWVFALPER
jgi:alcohol dehydrogenase (cytochrome c)